MTVGDPECRANLPGARTGDGDYAWLRPIGSALVVVVVVAILRDLAAGFLGAHVAWDFAAWVAWLAVAPLLVSVFSFRRLAGRLWLRFVGAALAAPVALLLLGAQIMASQRLYLAGLATAVRYGVNFDRDAVGAWTEVALARAARGGLRLLEEPSAIEGAYYLRGEVHPDDVAPGVMTGLLQRRGTEPAVYLSASCPCVDFLWRHHGIRVRAGDTASTAGFGVFAH